MMSRRSLVKFIALLVIIIIGVLYWFYAERRSSPLEEVQKLATPTTGSAVPDLLTLVPTTLIVPEPLRQGVFAVPRTLHVPPGWSVSLYASGLGKARFMDWGPNGKNTILVTSIDRGQVLALADENGDGVADGVTVFAKGLNKPNGISVRYRSAVYVAETHRVVKLSDTDENDTADLYDPFVDGLPTGGNHFTRSILWDTAGDLLISVGSTCNVCVDAPRRAALLRYLVGESRLETFASGLRNSMRRNSAVSNRNPCAFGAAWSAFLRKKVRESAHAGAPQ